MIVLRGHVARLPQAQRVLHLVNDLLDAAVLERVAFELQLEGVDLHGLLEDIIAT